MCIIDCMINDKGTGMSVREKRRSPVVVLINNETCSYKRYVGKSMTDQIKAEQPLSRWWIEQFRVDPESLYDDCGDDDESA